MVREAIPALAALPQPLRRRSIATSRKSGPLQARYCAGRGLVVHHGVRTGDMALRHADLVDLNGIEALAGIERGDGHVRIGAMTRHAAVAASHVVREAIPALAALAGSIGDVQVHHRGTIGGSICFADPAADYPAGLLGLERHRQHRPARHRRRRLLHWALRDCAGGRRDRGLGRFSDPRGKREYIQVLRLHEDFPERQVAAAVRDAVKRRLIAGRLGKVRQPGLALRDRRGDGIALGQLGTPRGHRR